MYKQIPPKQVKTDWKLNLQITIYNYLFLCSQTHNPDGFFSFCTYTTFID